MRKLKLKGLVLVTAVSAVILTGCTSHEDIIINDYKNNTEQHQTFEPVIPNVQEQINSDVETEEPSKEQFTFFSDAKQELIEYIESEEFEQLASKGKYYVTTGIDFVFFGTEINGVTFDELSTDLKTRVMNDIAALDQATESYYPNYKESLSSKYQVAAEFVSSKYLEILDAIREYLGDENYSAVGEIKDQIMGDISTKKDEAIEDIKELYKSWRDK